MLLTRLLLQLFAEGLYYLAYLLRCNMPSEYTLRTTASLHTKACLEQDFL